MGISQSTGESWSILSKRIPWYGAVSGYYGMLPVALGAAGIPCNTVFPRVGIAARVAGKCWSWFQRLPARHQSVALAEWEFLRSFDRRRAPGLMLALEDNLPLLGLRRFANGAARRLIGVIHYPPELWTDAMLRQLARLRSALVLYRTDIEFFEQRVGIGRVRFVPHGVDTVHFSPGGGPRRPGSRYVVSGQFGRDFSLLLAVFRRLRERRRDCLLDIVGTHHARMDPALRELSALPGVSMHDTCSHEKLLALYRDATAMLLPLKVGAANNALVEALACGTPAIATDIGGVRDYGGGKIFPVTPPGDAAAMAEVALALAADAGRGQAMGAAEREFAETQLAWPVVATRHREAVQLLWPDECQAG